MTGLAFWALAAVGLGAAHGFGCGSDEPARKPERECPDDGSSSGCFVVADPCPRLVLSDDCESAYDCPSGTECLPGQAPVRVLQLRKGTACSACSDDSDSADPSCRSGASSSTGPGGASSTTGSTGGASGAGGAGGSGGSGGSGGEGGRGVGESVDLGKRSHCGVPVEAAPDRYALATGFDVVTFGLTRNVKDDGGLSFTYTAPEDTTVVTCAVFRCPPAVASGSQDESSPFEVATVLNFDQCVLSYQQYQGRQGEVLPKELRPPPRGSKDETLSPASAGSEASAGYECAYAAPEGYATPTADACIRPNCPGTLYDCPTEPLHEDLSWERFATTCPITTRLLLGCWSMNANRVTAATLLEQLSPAEVGNYCGYFADKGCSGDTKGRACTLPSPFTRPGVCWDTQSAGVGCLPTCTSDQDCAGFPAPGLPRDPATDTAPSSVCDRSGAPTVLGVCR